MDERPLFKVLNIGECPLCGPQGKITAKFRNTDYVALSPRGSITKWTNIQNHVGTAFCSTCMKKWAAIDLSDLVLMPGVVRIVPFSNVKDVLQSYINAYAKDDVEIEENPLIKPSEAISDITPEEVEEAISTMGTVVHF